MRNLLKAKRLVMRLECKLSKLTHHGFVRKATGSSSGYIYIDKKNGVVVKRPYITYHGKDKGTPRHAVKTLVIKSPYNRYEDLDRVFIQPLVDTSMDAQNNACRHFERRNVNPYSDLKESNCGMYRGKPVVIDW